MGTGRRGRGRGRGDVWFSVEGGLERAGWGRKRTRVVRRAGISGLCIVEALGLGG